MKKGKKTKQIGRLNAKPVLFFSCALFLVMMLTCGITMAYFGGMADGLSSTLTIKSGIVFDTTGADSQKIEILSDYLVPGTSVDALCVVTIASKATSNIQYTAVNGLLRADFAFSGDMKDFVSISDTSADVYLGSSESDMIEENKVAKLVKSSDGYWYLVADTTTTAIQDSTMLYEVDCKTSGKSTLLFKISVDVGNLSSADSSTQFVNSHFGKSASLDANFKVVQAEFYKDSTTPLPVTYKNAIEVFGSV